MVDNRASVRLAKAGEAAFSDLAQPDIAEAICDLLDDERYARRVELHKRSERVAELSVREAAELVRRAHEGRAPNPWRVR